MVSDKPNFKEVFLKFIDWYGEKNKSNLASFGIYYDLPLLRKEVRVSGLNYGDYFVGGGLDIKSTVPVMIYTEATPNPATLKFVVNRPLMPDDFVELQNLEEAKGAPLAVHLFELGQISTVFVSQNFITITKEEDVMWAEIMLPIKEKIKLYGLLNRSVNNCNTT